MNLWVVLWGGLSVCAMATDSSTSSTSTTTSTTLESSFYFPEVWRLPPVSGDASASSSNITVSPTIAATKVTTPTALNLPTIDNFSNSTASPSSPPGAGLAAAPASNFPVAISGITIDNKMCAEQAPKPVKLWSGNLDFGLDGENGSSDTFNLRLGFRANRKTEQTVLSLGVDYLKQTADNEDTADRLFAEGRFEWLFQDSRWSIFVHETCEYNEFTDYRVCDTADTGFGYRLIKNDNTTLIGRFGGGYSHYYGGEYDGEYYPESVFGLSFEHKIGKREKFLLTVEYAADVTNYERYRIRSQAAVEFLLSEETNLNLKIGVLERYTSLQHETPGNDVDYALMLMWKF